MRFFKQCFYTVRMFRLPVTKVFMRRTGHNWFTERVHSWRATKMMLDCWYGTRKTQKAIES
jgi:hypothetical protein